ncbi:MAG: Ig-like domain-containing protein [Bacteroidales bacterium]|nr:Ig-like domain-containing protein [Bacteroidales bacterium]
MKRITLFLAITAALIGCQETLTNTEVQENAESFEAMVEGFEDKTKTAMTDERNIVWSEEDRIAIFQGSNVADKYILKDEAAGTGKGEFTLESDESEVNGDFTSGMEIRTNIALYPYSDDLTCTDISIRLNDSEELKAYKIENITLPSVQEYVPESFGEGTFPMVAVTETMADHKLNFKNVMGAIKLQLKGTQIVKNIKIEGNNNEILSGAASITAYVDDLPPVIKPNDATATSVTLDCGDGVQLDESTATDFIIALSPVLFSQGFKVTVTDDASQTYAIETSVANTVLRSSILVMPTVILADEVTEDGEGDTDSSIKVLDIVFDKSTLTLAPSTSYSIVTIVVPDSAEDKTLTWSSSAPTVATVDQSGVVTAVSDGTATITAVAVGGASKLCIVDVISLPGFATATADYVDEYGVNHGKGIAIGRTVWAPVNCGYKAADTDANGNVTDKGFPYGKLYQWGRKYGQGYSLDYDSSVPTVEEGPVSMAYGQSDSMKEYFFMNSSSPYDWVSTQDDELWNSGTEDSPVKTSNDPCPDGWRVPTCAELNVLRTERSEWTSQNGQNGYYFSGVSATKYATPPVGEDVKIFFPAAGYRHCGYGDPDDRGHGGYYWSSWPNGSDAYILRFYSGNASVYDDSRALGYPVRCVQE